MWFPGFWKLIRWVINWNWRRGRHEANERLARWYANWRPNDFYGWWVWAHILYQQRRYPEAEQVLLKGLEHHPNDPEVGWLLSKTLMAHRKSAEARRLLEAQRAANPHNRLPYLGLQELASRDRDWTKADRWAREALKRTSASDYAGKYELALQWALVPGALERAISLLREACEGLPRFALCHVLLGVLLEGEENEEARKHIDRARRFWKSRDSFDEFLEDSRQTYGTLRSGDEPTPDGR